MYKIKKRSKLRLYLGKYLYIVKRYLKWQVEKKLFSSTLNKHDAEHIVFSHSSPIIRKLSQVDIQLQHNKKTNLAIAIKKLNKIIIKPNEVFSFWYLVGNPSKKKGYVPGFSLSQGKLIETIGGGLCQLSNLIFWMSLHTPLTIAERHRHTYDVFPDSNRTVPFGSGATVAYNYIDLQLLNKTTDTFQLKLWIKEDQLHGQWLCNNQLEYSYKIIEEGHKISHFLAGTYLRQNKLYKVTYDKASNKEKSKQLIVENNALMMYNPLLNEAKV